MTATIDPLPRLHGDACWWCSDPRDGHGRQWHPVAGFHDWQARRPVSPAQAQPAPVPQPRVDVLAALAARPGGVA